MSSTPRRTGTKTVWMVEAGTPNTLFRRGITRNTVPIGTVVIIDGFQAKDGANRANGRRMTLANGETLFMGLEWHRRACGWR